MDPFRHGQICGLIIWRLWNSWDIIETLIIIWNHQHWAHEFPTDGSMCWVQPQQWWLPRVVNIRLWGIGGELIPAVQFYFGHPIGSSRKWFPRGFPLNQSIECWLFGGQVLFLAKVWILLGHRICTISLGGIAFWRSDPYTYLGSSAARPILGWLDVAWLRRIFCRSWTLYSTTWALSLPGPMDGKGLCDLGAEPFPGKFSQHHLWEPTCWSCSYPLADAKRIPGQIAQAKRLHQSFLCFFTCMICNLHSILIQSSFNLHLLSIWWLHASLEENWSEGATWHLFLLRLQTVTTMSCQCNESIAVLLAKMFHA